MASVDKPLFVLHIVEQTLSGGELALAEEGLHERMW